MLWDYVFSAPTSTSGFAIIMSLVDLLQSLNSQQLQAVAEWLRETASEYASAGEKTEADVLTAQASKLETLVAELNHTCDPREQAYDPHEQAASLATKINRRQRQTNPSRTVKGWLQSLDGELTYLLMGDGSTVRQTLDASDSEVSAPCTMQEMEQAYRSGRFSILAGADYLATYFSESAPDDILSDDSGWDTAD